VAARLVVDEVTASGFALVNVIDDWPGRGPLESYCAVFRKAEPTMGRRRIDNDVSECPRSLKPCR
jgi:hypothetical protein